MGWGQDNSGREGCGLPVLIHLCLAPVEVGGGGWWTDATLHFWQVLALGGARISWAALGAILLFPSLGWNVMEDPGGERGGGGSLKKRLFQSLPARLLVPSAVSLLLKVLSQGAGKLSF